MSKYKGLTILLIFMILIINIYVLLKGGDIKNKHMYNSNIVSNSSVALSIKELVNKNNDIDMTDIMLRLRDENSYFKYKTINYDVMKFFRSINENKFENIRLSKDFIDSVGGGNSCEYLDKVFGNRGVFFYEILKIEDIDTHENKISLRYKTENDDRLFYKTFYFRDRELSIY